MNREHSTVREGLIAGLLGALIVAAWYFAVDLGRGEIFYTPNVLGQVFVQGDTIPTTRTVTSQAVIQYSLLHLGIFILFGLALTGLTHLAIRNPALRMAVWLGLVIGFLFFLGFLYMLHRLTDQAFPIWTSFAASVLGVGAMGLYLWRRHPQLRSEPLPLGAEVKPPPHPPGAPRV